MSSEDKYNGFVSSVVGVGAGPLYDPRRLVRTGVRTAPQPTARQITLPRFDQRFPGRWPTEQTPPTAPRPTARSVPITSTPPPATPTPGKVFGTPGRYYYMVAGNETPGNIAYRATGSVHQAHELSTVNPGILQPDGTFRALRIGEWLVWPSHWPVI